MKRTFLAALTGALLSALVVGGGFALAQSDESEPSLYYGCKSERSGRVSRISAGVEPRCPRSAVLVAWNEAGPQGAPGDPAVPCGVVDNSDGTADLSCPDGTSVTLATHSGDSSLDRCASSNLIGGADLSGCNLDYLQLSQPEFSGANLSGASLRYATFFASQIGQSTNSGDHRGALAGAVNFSGADLTGFTAEAASFPGSDFSNANLTDARFGFLEMYPDFRDTNFSGANLTHASFYRAQLQNSDLSGADLTNAYLYRANLYGADLTDATWDNTTCPNGTNSDSNPRCGY